MLERLGGICRREAIDAAARRRIDFEQSTLAPRPETIAVLDGLRSKGVRIGLVSNCSIETVLAWQDCVLARYIEHATFSCIVRADKPDAASYLDALAALESAPRESLFVGDGSSNELAGAERIGMKSVLIRAEDDDGTFPGRIAASDWHGAAVSRLAEVSQFIGAGWPPPEPDT
jgi:putative hydrolase of the HAD superfamily